MEDTAQNKWLITITVMLGTLLSALDTSIVNVAIPYMRGNLGASVEEITWVATGYILSTVIVMPIVGMLSARFGRKRFYLYSVIVFTSASMLCGMAWDLTSMVIFRVLQGLGGGALIPVSQAILRETFPPEEQGMAMGIYGFGVVLGPAFGPTLGGWLTDHYSWPWIFYINLPVGIINIGMVTQFIHDPEYLAREKGKIDFSGLAFMAVGLGALQLVLEKGEQKNWFESSMIKYLALTSLVGLLLFVWRELTADRPAVNLRLLKDSNFSTSVALGGLLGIGLYGSLFLLPLFMQQLLGYPAYTAGLTLMPRSIAMALTMPIVGRFYNKVGPRALLVSGLIISAFSFYNFSVLSLDVGFWNIFVPQFLQGVGFGLVFVALSTAALSTIEKPQMTDASGLFNVVRQVFGSVGIALAATQLTKWETYDRAVLVEQLTGFREAATHWLGTLGAAMTHQGADQVSAQAMALKALEVMTTRQAAMLAFNHVFFLMTGLFIVSLPLALLIRHAKGEANKDVTVDGS